jgi:tRNA (cytidine/uridine-2'-O-)-methyltransferase
MFHIILFQPEIPPNTGNIIRLCVNTGSKLHLIHPLGFQLEDKQLRRAGLDYREYADVCEYQTLQECLDKISAARLFAISTKARTSYAEISYQQNDAFLFGPETRGLPRNILDAFDKDRKLYIPMQTNSRSLNLANTVAILVYEAWRQNGFTSQT